MQAGGDRLVATQNPDGGWAFPLIGPSALNTIAPIGIGLEAAYRTTGDPSHLTAINKVAALLLARNNNFSLSDGRLAAVLDEVYGGATYRQFVKTNFYDKLAAGTYNRSNLGTLYSTSSLVAQLHVERGASAHNLVTWETGLGLAGAVDVGATATDWVTAERSEVNQLTAGDDYDVLGLGAAVYGLARAGDTSFNPSAGSFAAASNLTDLANTLASYQLSTGGYTYNTLTMVVNSDETVQETVYASLALNELNQAGYLTNLSTAANYLRLAQLVNGSWENYVGAGENNSVTGEALLGFFTAVPEPSSLVIFGLASVYIVQRRRV